MPIQPSESQYLALDIGKRTTGVAFGRPVEGIALALDSIQHQSVEQLLSKVEKIVHERSVTHLIVGLPLLPSGLDGAESRSVRKVAEKLGRFAPVTLIDERYSNIRGATDDHVVAAQLLLEIALKQADSSVDKR